MFRFFFRIQIILLLFLASVSLLFPGPEFEGSMIVYADSSQYWEEMLQIQAKMGIEYDLASGMELELFLSMDEFEVKPDKILVTIKAGESMRIGVGYKENFMTLEEKKSSFDRSIQSLSLITVYYNYLGYVSRSLGVEVYNKNTWYIRGGVSSIHPYEPLFSGSYFFHPFGEKSFYGISLLYLANYRTVHADHGNDPHHFAFSLHAADSTGPWSYSLESAFGSNYPAPIGYMTLPTDDSERSYFLGFDCLFTRDISFRQISWVSGLRYSLLFPDFAYAEFYKQRGAIANQLYISEDAKVFMDLYLEHERPYLDISGEDDEYTFAVFIGLQVKTN